MKNILIVGSQHGNELLGELLYGYLKDRAGSFKLTYCLANPRAREANVRCVESDMNRSYAPDGKTYEAQQAQRLLRFIRARRFDLVIDAHTTTVDQAPCMIVPGITDENRAFLRASHVTNVVVMKHDFINQSLIGHVPQAVSLEVSVSRLGTPLFQAVYDDLLAYNLDRIKHPKKAVFTVEDVLRKSAAGDLDVAALRNFERSAAGFYPVLMGEAAYRQHTDYLGFAAKSKQIVRI